MTIHTQKLLIAMANACMTSSDLCTAAGISKQTLFNIKSGKQNPKPITLGKIARALNVKPEELVIWDDADTPSSN